MLKDATAGLFRPKLFATCWGMLFQVFRLGYLGFKWVCLGFVSGAVVHIRLFYPCRALVLDDFGFLRSIGRTVGLGQDYCARRSVFSSVLLGFAGASIVFCAKLHYWTL